MMAAVHVRRLRCSKGHTREALWASWGPFWDHLGPSLALLGTSCALLGPLAPPWAFLGTTLKRGTAYFFRRDPLGVRWPLPFGLFLTSGGTLGTSWAPLGLLLGSSWHLLGPLGPSRARLGSLEKHSKFRHPTNQQKTQKGSLRLPKTPPKWSPDGASRPLC
mgnify:CR=1 FL=1